MLEPGTLVGGDYLVERKLSEGGMGAVFVAEQVSTGAKRALKVIRPELLSQPKLRQRFAQEAKVTSGIASDHVVSVVAAGIDAQLGVPWLAMELLSGQTLYDLVADRGALPVDVALEILRQLTHAVDAAHAVGVVHRDLKPENIFLSESRRTGFPFFVKVLDFGIARIVREAQVTHTDSIGTPLWMAPEQAGTADEVGPWTDVWALGLIVFFLLTGRSYWLSARGPECSALGLVKEVCIDPFAPAGARARELGFAGELPAAFDAWFAGCVAREPAARFASAGQALAALGPALGEVRSEPTVSAALHGRPAPPSASVDSDVAHAKTEIGLPVTARSRVELGEAASGREHHVEVHLPSTARGPGATSAQAPPVSVTTPEAGAPRPPRRAARAVGAVLVLAAAFGVAFGARAVDRRMAAAKAAATCHNIADEGACRQACAAGDSASCTRAALRGVSGRDEAEAARSRDVLKVACERGSGEACGGLGHALVFKVRDLKAGVEALERACGLGASCALLGALKEGGVAGIARDSASYFNAACTEEPKDAASVLDCGWAVAHALEGPPGGAVPARLAQHAARSWRDACTQYGGDVCALSWLDAAATPQDLFASYGRGCDAGSWLACNNLGALRAEGAPGTPPNPALAREAFERACAAGEATACNNLAFVQGGLSATPRRGPRGATLYKLRCGGPFQVGCAGWGARAEVLPKGTPTSLAEAFASLERGCAGGLTTACVNLGAFLFTGHGAARDRARAERLFAESCFRGDASGCGEQGTALLAIRMDHPRDVRAGVGFLERACKGGELDSCMALYGHMVNTHPDAKREAEGLAGLQRLAGQKVYAQAHVLTALYETGATGLPRDLAKARALALEECAAERRCVDAAYYLSRGLGGGKDERRAIEALGTGCEADDFASCTELGVRHRDGQGVGRDLTRAVELFRRACDRADAPACAELSRAYARAEGVPRDPSRALALARTACDSGSAEGCAAVGVMLSDGVGAPKDPDAGAAYLGFGCRRAVQAACEKLQKLGKPLPELDL